MRSVMATPEGKTKDGFETQFGEWSFEMEPVGSSD